MALDYDHQPVTVEGKTTVVVGGTSGIGEAIALGFASEGADVVATSRSADKVATTTDALRDLGASTIEQPCDVTDRKSLTELRDAVLDEFGSVDVLVNSPGTISRQAVLDIDEEMWDHVHDVLLDGIYRSLQVFAGGMESGSIVNISSLASYLAFANAPAYSSAKGGVNSLTRVAAKELAPEIRVNAIAPGFVLTPQNRDQYREGTEKRSKIEERTPLGRVAEREEMVGATIYLASDAGSYTTGEIITVDGGFSDSVF